MQINNFSITWLINWVISSSSHCSLAWIQWIRFWRDEAIANNCVEWQKTAVGTSTVNSRSQACSAHPTILTVTRPTWPVCTRFKVTDENEFRSPSFTSDCDITSTTVRSDIASEYSPVCVCLARFSQIGSSSGHVMCGRPYDYVWVK